jgi:hypothetical protein
VAAIRRIRAEIARDDTLHYLWRDAVEVERCIDALAD